VIVPDAFRCAIGAAATRVPRGARPSPAVAWRRDVADFAQPLHVVAGERVGLLVSEPLTLGLVDTNRCGYATVVRLSVTPPRQQKWVCAPCLYCVKQTGTRRRSLVVRQTATGMAAKNSASLAASSRSAGRQRGVATRYAFATSDSAGYSDRSHPKV
jgi:transposase-like protein